MKVAYVVRGDSIYDGDLLDLVTRIQTANPVVDGEFRKDFWSLRFKDKDWYDRFIYSYSYEKESKGIASILEDVPTPSADNKEKQQKEPRKPLRRRVVLKDERKTKR
jgi:hypothetical protein